MPNEQPFADLYSGLIGETCAFIRLPLEVNEIIYWWYVLQGHPEKDF